MTRNHNTSHPCLVIGMSKKKNSLRVSIGGQVASSHCSLHIGHHSSTKPYTSASVTLNLPILDQCCVFIIRRLNTLQTKPSTGGYVHKEAAATRPQQVSPTVTQAQSTYSGMRLSSEVATQMVFSLPIVSEMNSVPSSFCFFCIFLYFLFFFIRKCFHV